MISVAEAIQLIQQNARLLPPISTPLQNALGLVLAEDLFAQISLPPFPQSAMDGYAFRFADWQHANALTIAGEVAAGDAANISVAPQQAVRIFTGAELPEGLDTVVMQEKTTVAGNAVIINDESLIQGSNVRAKGSEIRRGGLALPKGTVLHTAAIGFLAGLGITEVKVHPKPNVYIVVTGKELQMPGVPLQRGQIYESNSMLLQTALAQLHINKVAVSVTGDDVLEIKKTIEGALQSADLVLVTGGVSVGDYDYVVQAAEACGVERLFHKVAQRPGKPLYAGLKGGKFLFGLPGNPASVLSCFYNYVVAAIEELTGRRPLLQRTQLPLLAAFNKKISLRQFLKAACNKDGVMPLSAQESFRLSSFSVANCLIILPEAVRDYEQGETVEVLLLPYL